MVKSKGQREESNHSGRTLSSMLSALSSAKNLLYAIFVLSFLGFLDSTYLTVLHYTGTVPPCDVTHACETVLTSKFATVGSIPIAVFGIGYFVAIMVLSILLFQRKHAGILRGLVGLTTLGFISALGLLYIQAFILHAYCQYCVAAEILMTSIFLLTGWNYVRDRRTEKEKH